MDKIITFQQKPVKAQTLGQRVASKVAQYVELQTPPPDDGKDSLYPSAKNGLDLAECGERMQRTLVQQKGDEKRKGEQVNLRAKCWKSFFQTPAGC